MPTCQKGGGVHRPVLCLVLLLVGVNWAGQTFLQYRGPTFGCSGLFPKDACVEETAKTALKAAISLDDTEESGKNTLVQQSQFVRSYQGELKQLSTLLEQMLDAKNIREAPSELLDAMIKLKEGCKEGMSRTAMGTRAISKSARCVDRLQKIPWEILSILNSSESPGNLRGKECRRLNRVRGDVKCLSDTFKHLVSNAQQVESRIETLSDAFKRVYENAKSVKQTYKVLKLCALGVVSIGLVVGIPAFAAAAVDTAAAAATVTAWAAAGTTLVSGGVSLAFSMFEDSRQHLVNWLFEKRKEVSAKKESWKDIGLKLAHVEQELSNCIDLWDEGKDAIEDDDLAFLRTAWHHARYAAGITCQYAWFPAEQATTTTSCVEISDCEEAAMELSSEEDKEREARNEDISSVSQLLKEVQTPSHQHFFIGEEVEDNAQQFYIGEEGMPAARRGLVEDESGDRALQQLRQRAGGVSKVSVDKTQVQPIVAEDGLSAVDTFRESAAKVTASPTDEGQKMPNGPTEQDLVIESVKRERSGGSWTSRTSRSSRQASSRRPHTGFFPAKRQVWGSSSGGSTCASSLTSSRSFVAALLPGKPDGFASDLTVGEDGMALAGNPLAAIRRRRRTNHERGEDEMDIRDLLRRFEAGVGQEEAPQVPVESQSRPATSDVRIRCRPQSASSPTSVQKSRNDSVISTGPKLKALGPEVLVIQ
eukprot:s1048_g13.t1